MSNARSEITDLNRVGTHKDVKQAMRKARKAGWRFFMGGGNHILAVGPKDQRLTFGLTPSESSARASIRDLRKNGAPV